MSWWHLLRPYKNRVKNSQYLFGENTNKGENFLKIIKKNQINKKVRQVVETENRACTTWRTPCAEGRKNGEVRVSQKRGSIVFS
jgi:hypothetical protein